MKDAWPRDRRVWVTFNGPDARSLLEGEEVVHAFQPTKRNLKNFVRNLFLAVRVVREHRPAAVVSTGAGVAVPFCYVGRVLGCRIVFVESFSRITEPSLTARLVHPVAHRFFVQWPELQSRFRKAEYQGGFF